MGSLFQQLGLDSTFYIQFVIFGVVYVVLSTLFFKPFLKLFEARHKRLVEDREAAEKLVSQADSKFEEYKARLTAERTEARKEYDLLILRAKKEEQEIIGAARDQAKKITQEAADSVLKQKEQIKAQLETEVEGLARTIADSLLDTRGAK